MFFAKLLKAISYIPAVVLGIENLFGSKSGDQKKASAVDLIGLIISSADAVQQKDIVDAGAFKDGLNQAIDGVVKMLNASVWHKS